MLAAAWRNLLLSGLDDADPPLVFFPPLPPLFAERLLCGMAGRRTEPLVCPLHTALVRAQTHVALTAVGSGGARMGLGSNLSCKPLHVVRGI